MEQVRQHAREAIKLVKQQQSSLKPTSTHSELIDMCTEVALRLQEGKLPKWYHASDGSVTSKETKNGREKSSGYSCPQLSLCNVAPTLDDQEATKKSTSVHEGESSSNSANGMSSKNSLESSRNPRQTSMLTSDTRSSKTSHMTLSTISLASLRPQLLSPSPKEPRISSSGLITTRIPSARLELPPVSTQYQNSLTGIRIIEMLKKKPLSAIEVRFRKASVQKKKQKRKGFSNEQETEMDESEIISEYWSIPFDPLREDVISKDMVCNSWKPDSCDEEEDQLNEKDILSDVTYWEIQRVLRFIRIGNPTATVLALCVLKEMDLSKASFKEVIHRLNGISLFLNILGTKYRRCRVAALKVLVLMASSKKTSNIILRKNGIQQLVSILDERDKLVVSLVCDVLALLAKHSDVRQMANKLDVIQKLMTLFQACVKTRLKDSDLTLNQSVCCALWSCSEGISEKDVSCVSKSLGVISHLVDSQKEALVVPLLGIVEACASLSSWRLKQSSRSGITTASSYTFALVILVETVFRSTKLTKDGFRYKMEKENLIEKVSSKVGVSEQTVQVLCVKILFKEYNDELLALHLGIVWRCSVNQKHRKKFENLGVFPFLVNILKSDKSLQVKSASLGVLSEFLFDKCYTESVANYGVVNLLITFMSSTETSVLINSARCLGVCARNSSWRGMILQQDGLRLLWSLLKSCSDEVLTSASAALASVCVCPEESAVTVRSIVGGLERLMSLLTSTELTKVKVLVSLCEAAVNVAKDAENLSILTDYGLVPAILRLCVTRDKILRYYVTCLISRCCETKAERSDFSNFIPFLVEGLWHKYDEHIRCASVCALHEISRDFSNCVFLRESSTKKVLLNLLGSNDERTQDAAAGCLANVRKSMKVKA